MKRFFLALLVCAMVLSFAGMSMAEDKKAAPAAPAATEVKPTAPAVKADAKHAEVTIMGEVVKDAHGAPCIKAADGEYKVAGKDKEVTALMGKKVKATGTVAEKDKMKTLHVIKVEEAK